MSRTWQSPDALPEPTAISPAGWRRLAAKGLPLVLIVFGGLILLLLLRLIERPIFGADRPWTPHITRVVCRAALWVIGIRFRVEGQVMSSRGALVANHGSWLDIFVLNAVAPLYFVSKSEVAGWPVIGWLARATGTIFITRETAAAKAQTRVMAARLSAGHRLCFFPEGTSTDGRRVLRFNSTLFGSFFDHPETLSIQPVTVAYVQPPGGDPRFYGWWGDMSFGEHFAKMLSAPRHGQVTVMLHEPLSTKAFENRKALARQAETLVSEAHAQALKDS